MTVISRRSLLVSSAIVPFAVWMDRFAAAQASLVRYDATSPQGQAMLKIYAAAVAKMTSGTPEANPSSWLFQWYTHAVRPDRTKAAEVARVYPTPGAPQTLAQDMWSSCQAHFVSQNEPFFLPWHRMYVYFFERIVRKVSGNASFTLPYWNYSTTETAKHGVMPREFRLPTDPVFSSLYRNDRNRPVSGNTQIPNVNAGDPLDRFAPGSLSLAVLKQGTFLPQPPAIPGFNQMIDFGLHGNVHVQIGGTQNMGSVPWAARDPIFWMHHSNIDRLWASWNRNGGKNPTDAWLTKTFVFVDENGTRVVAKVDDFKDLGPLGYAYDRLEPAPPAFQGLTTLAPGGAGAGTVLMRASVALGATAAQVALEPTAAPIRPLSERVTGLTATRRWYLAVSDLRTDVAPGVLYNVYVNLPPNVTAADRNAYLAGTINFFEAAPHEGHEPADGTGARLISFDVTEIFRRLQSRQLADKPVVTIAPVGRPSAAKPVVGDIAIVER